jgi:predicted RNA-binding protein with TRAM domain
MPKPVKVGEEYDVEISEVGSKGDGIARVKNFVVFVTGVKQGEKCKIKIKEVRNRFAIGEKVGAGAESSEAGEAKAGEAEAGKVEAEAETEEVEAEAEDATEEEVVEAEEE